MTRKQVKKTVSNQFSKENRRWTFQEGYYLLDFSITLKDICMRAALYNYGDRIVVERLNVRIFRTPITNYAGDSIWFEGEDQIGQIVEWLTDTIIAITEKYASLFEKVAEMRRESDRAAAQLILNS